MEPLAARIAPDDFEQLHHSHCDVKVETRPIEDVLTSKADALVGGDDAHLIIDDTGVPKKGNTRSGLRISTCGALGKQA